MNSAETLFMLQLNEAFQRDALVFFLFFFSVLQLSIQHRRRFTCSSTERGRSPVLRYKHIQLDALHCHRSGLIMFEQGFLPFDS